MRDEMPFPCSLLAKSCCEALQDSTWNFFSCQFLWEKRKKKKGCFFKAQPNTMPAGQNVPCAVLMPVLPSLVSPPFSSDMAVGS